ncbi:MAG: hypothetical protein ACLS54_05525 [Anaerostipes hadrus]
MFEGCATGNGNWEIYMRLAKQCPDTTIVLDHMGIVDPDIISKKDPTIQEQAYKEKWKHYLNQMEICQMYIVRSQDQIQKENGM